MLGLGSHIKFWGRPWEERKGGGGVKNFFKKGWVLGEGVMLIFVSIFGWGWLLCVVSFSRGYLERCPTKSLRRKYGVDVGINVSS